MNILVACEYSGITREALRRQGHNAISADILPTDQPSGAHYQGDVLPLLYPELRDMVLGHITPEQAKNLAWARYEYRVACALEAATERYKYGPRIAPTEREVEILLTKWDGLIAHPDCTFLTVTGNRWNAPKYRERFPQRAEQREAAINFFFALADAKVLRKCIEQPRSIMATIYRKPDQWVQPFWFGHKEPKQSFYWLTGLPKLVATDVVEPEYHITGSGKRVPKWFFFCAKKDRAKARSKSFQGIADAMSTQWFQY